MDACGASHVAHHVSQFSTSLGPASARPYLSCDVCAHPRYHGVRAIVRLVSNLPSIYYLSTTYLSAYLSIYLPLLPSSHCYSNHILTPTLPLDPCTPPMHSFLRTYISRLFHLSTNILFECTPAARGRGITGLFPHHLAQLCGQEHLGFGFSAIAVFYVCVYRMLLFLGGSAVVCGTAVAPSSRSFLRHLGGDGWVPHSSMHSLNHSFKHSLTHSLTRSAYPILSTHYLSYPLMSCPLPHPRLSLPCCCQPPRVVCSQIWCLFSGMVCRHFPP